MKNPFIQIALAISLAAQAAQREVYADFKRWSAPKSRGYGNSSGKYQPHQGKQECARRVKQLSTKEQ